MRENIASVMANHETRFERPRRCYWMLLIVPLIAVVGIVLAVACELFWEDIRADMDETAAAQSHPATGPTTVEPESQFEVSRKEAASLRQQLTEARLHLQQQNAALVTANENVQTLKDELAEALQKLAEAKTGREESLRVAANKREERRH